MTDSDQFKVMLTFLAIVVAFGIGMATGWKLTIEAVINEALNSGRGVFHTDGKTSNATFYWVVP